MPFPDASFDLVCCHGVIHHIPGAQTAVEELQRVLRPSGRAVVMLYHRGSFNCHVTIMGLRRLLAGLLPMPGASRLTARATGENLEVLVGRRQLLEEHGLRYLRDRQLFLNNNTDGLGNPLSRVYSARQARSMFAAAGFRHVQTHTRYLNLTIYPGGQRFSQTEIGRRAEPPRLAPVD